MAHGMEGRVGRILRDKLKDRPLTMHAIYEPTGVQEKVIEAVGNAPAGRLTIVFACMANKVGKTAVGANILSRLSDPNAKLKPYWQYPNFEKWPFPHTGRIIGTTTNVADTGPIQRELRVWLNPAAVKSEKAGKEFQSSFRAENSWRWDVMTYNQEADEFEGPLVGFTWSDEPPPARLVGAITSRHSKGGIWLITATPWDDSGQIGIFLDLLDDLEAKGTRVVRLYADIWANSTTIGWPNSTNTKRGLMTDAEIQSYIASIPPDQREARINGKPTHKSGKIYPQFDEAIHVRDIDLSRPECRLWNCVLAIDPHPKAYTAAQWWAITPDGRYVCYNEWPTFDFLGEWYADVRDRLTCPYTIEQLSEFFKIMDGKAYGLNIVGRAIDPWFAKGTEGEYGRKTESLLTEYAKYGLQFDLPPFQKIQVQRERIQQLLYFDKATGVVPWNLPNITIASHCLNTRRAFARHYWLEGKQREAAEYKEFVDTARIFFAYTENWTYQEITPPMGPAALRKKDASGAVPFTTADYLNLTRETRLA